MYFLHGVTVFQISQVTGETVTPCNIVATDIASTARIPNLIPDEWQPHIAALIMRAIDKDWGNPATDNA
jgi:hypothetical protein